MYHTLKNNGFARIIFYICILILIYILSAGIKTNEFFELTNKTVNLRTVINNINYNIICIKRFSEGESLGNKINADCNDSILLLMDEADVKRGDYYIWNNDFKIIKGKTPENFILSGVSVPVRLNENNLHKTMINQHLSSKGRNMLCGDEISYGEVEKNDYLVEVQFEQQNKKDLYRLKMKQNSVDMYIGKSDKKYLYNNKLYNRLGLFAANNANILDFSIQKTKNN